MAETKCPLCGKSLINGRCDDCGFYDDNVKLENESSSFYTEDYGSSAQSGMNNGTVKEEHTVYVDGVEKKVMSVFVPLLKNQDEKNGQGLQNGVLVVFIVLAIFIPMVGLIFGIALIKNSEEKTGKLAKILIIIGALRLIFQFAFAFM